MKVTVWHTGFLNDGWGYFPRRRKPKSGLLNRGYSTPVGYEE